MYKIVILPLAKQDIQENAKWYNEKQKGLGLKFTNAIRSEIKIISKNPKAIINRYRNVHTCVVRTFPYMIHYVIEDNLKKIVIIAVFQTKQSTDRWNRKL